MLLDAVDLPASSVLVLARRAVRHRASEIVLLGLQLAGYLTLLMLVFPPPTSHRPLICGQHGASYLETSLVRCDAQAPCRSLDLINRRQLLDLASKGRD